MFVKYFIGMATVCTAFYFFIENYWLVPVQQVVSANNPADKSTDPSLNQIQALAAHLEKNPQLLNQLKDNPSTPQNTASPTAPTGAANTGALFSDGFINGLKSQKVRDVLANLNEQTAADTLLTIADGISQADPDDYEEKQKFLQVYFFVDKKFSLNASQDVYVQQAEQNIYSPNVSVSNYGKAALQFYLDSQPDPDTQEAKRKEFYATYKPPQNGTNPDDSSAQPKSDVAGTPPSTNQSSGASDQPPPDPNADPQQQPPQNNNPPPTDNPQ